MSNGNLTKEEALQAMKEGSRVSREYFSSEEYIYIDPNTGCIRAEDGCCFDDWWNVIEPYIPKTSETPWRIV